MKQLLRRLARRPYTRAQLAGTRCARCGRQFRPGEQTYPHGLREGDRMAVCNPDCILMTVPAVEALFTALLPDALPWRLGVDGNPDPAHLATLPTASVVVRHGGLTIPTGPIPVSYAYRICEQAEKLGLSAWRVDSEAGR